MKNKFYFLITASVLATGLSACSERQSVLNNPPGSYESSTTSTDAAGTTVKKDTTTDVYVAPDGKKKAVVKSKTSKDPRGLFNKSSDTRSQVIEEK